MMASASINPDKLNINATNNQGQSLIWLASKKGFAGIVTFCLTMKADVKVRDKAGRNCFDVAKTKKCRELIRKGLTTNYMRPVCHGGTYSQQNWENKNAKRTFFDLFLTFFGLFLAFFGLILTFFGLILAFFGLILTFFWPFSDLFMAFLWPFLAFFWSFPGLFLTFFWPFSLKKCLIW